MLSTWVSLFLIKIPIARLVSLRKIKKHNIWGHLMNEKIIDKLYSDDRKFNTIIWSGQVYKYIYFLFAKNNYPTLQKVLEKLSSLNLSEAKIMMAGVLLILGTLAFLKKIRVRTFQGNNSKGPQPRQYLCAWRRVPGIGAFGPCEKIMARLELPDQYYHRHPALHGA